MNFTVFSKKAEIFCQTTILLHLNLTRKTLSKQLYIFIAGFYVFFENNIYKKT